MLVNWTIWEFVSESGRRPFSDWLNSLSDQAAACILARLLALESVPKWPDKWASDYKGYDGIIELRIPYKNVQFRPLGMYGKHQRGSFVLLAGAIEKGKIPRRDLETAANRRKSIISGRANVRRYEY